MAVKIRLRRIGAKKSPFYRVVVSDSRRARDGKFIEEIGFYDPGPRPCLFKIDSEKIKSWLSVGARPSNVVNRLLKENKVL